MSYINQNTHCNYVGCHCEVDRNTYYCPTHIVYGNCNFIHDCGKICKENSYWYIYCYAHYYMEVRYIILHNEKIKINNPWCKEYIINNVYMCYDKHKLKCKYKSLDNFDKSTDHYKIMFPRWTAMWLVFKHYMNNEALDIFSNVANYYIHL